MQIEANENNCNESFKNFTSSCNVILSNRTLPHLHPRIVAIKKNYSSGLSFSFSQVERHEIMKKNYNLNTNKAT